MRLTAEVVLWGLVCFSVIRCHSGFLQHCDNGKVKLETDLPPPEELLCPKLRPVSPSPGTSPALQTLDISTKYSLQPAEQVCMDLPITYNHTIPNSGAHRPVGAQSGEYLYCPPQRWINNLRDGATVLLFHPCASAEARRSLAVVAHSCLPHFILTAHPHLSQRRPFALVSWGHTLEMSHITAAGVCDWLYTYSSTFNQTTTTTTTSQSQNYNLYLSQAAPVDRVLDTSMKSLKACCMAVLSAYEVTARARKSRSVLQTAEREMKKEVVKHSKNQPVSTESSMLNSTHPQPLNSSEEKDTLSISPHGNVAPPLHAAVHSEKHSDDIEGTDAKSTATQLKKLKEAHGNTRGQEIGVKMKESQTDVNSPKMNNNLSAGSQRIKTDVSCAVPGNCGPPDVATAVLGGPLRGHSLTVQHTDEAVWAAAALGFLLMLLTLSVLHTRLYRNCRAPSSLYWPESQQDYESVADIIRRRLRMVGRRKRRVSQSRRQECPLLSDSSTDND